METEKLEQMLQEVRGALGGNIAAVDVLEKIGALAREHAGVVDESGRKIAELFWYEHFSDEEKEKLSEFLAGGDRRGFDDFFAELSERYLGEVSNDERMSEFADAIGNEFAWSGDPSAYVAEMAAPSVEQGM